MARFGENGVADPRARACGIELGAGQSSGGARQVGSRWRQDMEAHARMSRARSRAHWTRREAANGAEARLTDANARLASPV
jgi:hypothetical protein